MKENEMYEDSWRRLSPGRALSGGRYRIEKLLAINDRGCAVYYARDQRFSRPCAVQEILTPFQNDSDEYNQNIEWFHREVPLLLGLYHPSLARLSDFFVEEGRFYLVTDFIEGRTLSEVLKREGNIAGVNGAHGLSETRACNWALQICRVLSYLHRQSPPIYFGELRPSNILVNDKDEITLLDFGIARILQGSKVAMISIQVTLGYVPPEQLMAMPEPRSDLYALGATLHRIVTHHTPVNNKPTVFSWPPVRTLRPDISIAFEQVIMKALAYDVKQRWVSAAEMEQAVLTMNIPPNRRK